MATTEHGGKIDNKNTVDCTHWCMNTYIFRYIWRKIYNKLIDCHIIEHPFQLNGIDNVMYKDHTLISDSRYGKSIFVIINGTKCKFGDNINTFYKYGYSFDNVQHIYDYEFDRIPWGDDLY